VVTAGDGGLREVVQPCVTISAVAAVDGSSVALLGASADEPTAVYRVPLDGDGPAGPVHRPRRAPLPPAWVSRAQPMAFATSGGEEAHLLHFPPTAPDLGGPPGDRPPLVVVCHGGPTGSVEPAFDAGVQLWTTRGFAVALVDYRGSSGYGRRYRRLLRDAWGVADAEDCAAAARFLADAGLADPGRMVVRGSSAGGFTALRALRAGGPFSAALVSYAVTDLRALAADTHKFESRYFDSLVGPWPEARAVYEARSPALHPEEIEGPVLLLQGEDDPVVPPDQALRMAEALRRRGLRCELELFPGEGHGFRRAETLARAARTELAFVSSVLGLDLPA
jgi:dipeptidyl aminopeptidase/acylaminoacyl peptidase